MARRRSPPVRVVVVGSALPTRDEIDALFADTYPEERAATPDRSGTA